MALFVAVPVKKTSEVDLVKPLKNVIASYYTSPGEAGNFDEAIESLNRMRKECTNKSLEFKHESSITSLEKYFDQLSNLEAKCPPSEVSIPFKWRDAMMSSSFLGSNALTLNSLGYEKMCILFNIAAGQSQTAASAVNESLTNDLALKMAAKFFCSASGIFQGLKHLVPGVVGSQDLTIDLNPDVLQVMHLLMLAQAQETFFYKAVNDNMKDGIIAKIASQCEEYYSDTLKYMQIKYSWPDKEWLPLINMKHLAFKGIMEYYQAIVCGQSQSFGEQLCRLTKSIEFLKQAEQKAANLFPSIFKEYSRKANRSYEEAKKDNEFIYHARIPEYSSLNPIGKANLAKATSIPDRFLPDQIDLFEKLLPISVQQSVVKLDARKQEIVNSEIASLRDLNNVLNTSLTSMNLPAAIEDVSGVSIPPSLKAKAVAIQQKGGLSALEAQLRELPDLLQRNKEILDETERMLSQEEESDRSLRDQFKDKWTRVPSEKLTAAWKDNINKYRNIIQNAIDADNKVRHKFDSQKEKIRLLTGSDHELMTAVPAGSTGGSSSNSPAVTRLKALMNQVEAIKNEREVIESELKNYSKKKKKNRFLKALVADGAVNEAALSAESLGEAYGPLQRQVRESRDRQEALLKDIEAAHSEFVRSKGSLSGQDAQRESFLADLAAAHDAYFEISCNLQEGTKFYNDLTQLLVNLQNKVSDFCFARKAEREEMCKDLQNKIVSAPTPVPPAAPSYHTPAVSVPPSVSIPPSMATQSNPQANLPFANPYQQYYYPPPPLPVGYNPYAAPPPPPAQCKFRGFFL